MRFVTVFRQHCRNRPPSSSMIRSSMIRPALFPSWLNGGEIFLIFPTSQTSRTTSGIDSDRSSHAGRSGRHHTPADHAGDTILQHRLLLLLSAEPQSTPSDAAGNGGGLHLLA